MNERDELRRLREANRRLLARVSELEAQSGKLAADAAKSAQRTKEAALALVRSRRREYQERLEYLDMCTVSVARERDSASGAKSACDTLENDLRSL